MYFRIHEQITQFLKHQDIKYLLRLGRDVKLVSEGGGA